jgi:hypothetical protein
MKKYKERKKKEKDGDTTRERTIESRGKKRSKHNEETRIKRNRSK